MSARGEPIGFTARFDPAGVAPIGRGCMLRAPMRNRVLAVLTALVASAFSLVLMECVVRVAAPQPPSWMAIYRSHPVLPFAVLPQIEQRIDTGETRWTVRTDAGGRRVGSTPPPADAPLLLVLGDSFAFGNGVDYEESFAGLLGADGAWRVMNAAIPGSGPPMYREMLDVQLAEGAAPARVLVAVYVGNDFLDCLRPRTVPIRDGVLGDPGGVRSLLKRRSHLYRLVAKAFHVAAPGQAGDRFAGLDLARPAAWEEPPLSAALPAFRDAIAGLAATAAERGLDLRAVVIPTRASVEARARGEGASAEHDPALPVAQATAALAALAIPFVDVSEVLADTGAERTFFPFDGHLTPLGNRVVAAAIVPLLARPAQPPAGGR